MKELNYLAAVNHRLQMDAAENVRQQRSAMRRIDMRSFRQAVRSYNRSVALDMALVSAMSAGIGIVVAFLSLG